MKKTSVSVKTCWLSFHLFICAILWRSLSVFSVRVSTFIPIFVYSIFFYSFAFLYPLEIFLCDVNFRFRPDCKECTNSIPGEFTWAESGEASVTLQNQLGVPVHKESFAALLQPGETIHTKLHFKPMRTGPISALTYVRNNLTILEVVQVVGQAANAQFKFGNRRPGSGTPLLFELAEKHLKDCESE